MAARLALRLTMTVAALVSVRSAPLAAQDRELHWRRMHVEAHLDRDGRLLVKETQVIVFTGDWNGGERTFVWSSPQRFGFDRMVRLDSATGQEIPMKADDLEVVDGYGWGDSRHLRWRSRRAEDPPFNGDERSYRIEFRYTNILLHEGDDFRLDHDFAFTDHAGAVEAYTLKLTLDPVWKAPADFTGEFGPLRLEPWYGFVVNIPLVYAGAGRPAAVVYGADLAQRVGVASGFVAAMLALIAVFFRREAGVGRFASPVSGSVVTDAWLHETVFRHRPEVVGAAWDERTDAAEVTAVLARLEQEGKIKSRVESSKVWVFTTTTLHLELTVDRSKLRDYECALIDGLFFGHRTKVTSDEIREHYRRTGFNPSGKISSPLKSIVERLVPDDPALPAPSAMPTVLLAVAGIASFIASARTREYDLVVGIPGIVGAMILFLGVMLPAARVWRDRVEGAATATLWFFVPLALMSAALLGVVLTGFQRVGLLSLVGMALIALAITRSVLSMAAWRYGPKRLQLRREMAAARRYFQEELKQPAPRLQDEWLPWLIAFGLARHMDRWFASFGRAGGATVGHHSSGASSWSSSGGGERVLVAV
jgi:hypothetical protein